MISEKQLIQQLVQAQINGDKLALNEVRAALRSAGKAKMNQMAQARVNDNA
ncbi:MAG: hypothetical protein KGJ57_01935 [Sphingomonadales bacterium]|nr:hypothetical protein [Sphingomonadales bacterium]MDE2168170.1 hypothetical protein [Sphingomonadales bacterium]